MEIMPGKHCILHDQDPNKNSEEFQDVLDSLIKVHVEESNFLNLAGVVFPSDWRSRHWECRVSFHGARFTSEDSFRGVSFNEDVSFRHAVFEAKTSFRFAEFQETADFSSAQFHRDASLSNVQFKKHTKFDDAVFQEKAFFDDTKFCDRVTFAHSEFRDISTFSHAVFQDEVHFMDPQFASMVNFSATFKGRCLFWGVRDNYLFATAKAVSFMGATFVQPGAVQFSLVDFSRCNFVEAEIRGVNFSSVRWLEQGRGIWRRKILYAHPGATRLELEDAYRQVRQSYESRGNYPEAGDFYYGEMEQKRRRTLLRAYSPSLIALYWLCSGYGERPFRAGGLLILLIACFTVLFLCAGMINVSDSSPYLLGEEFLERAQNFFRVMWAYTLRSVTFGTPLYIKPQSEIGDLLTTFARIVVPIQAALFLLAINRKFRR